MKNFKTLTPELERNYIGMAVLFCCSIIACTAASIIMTTLFWVVQLLQTNITGDPIQHMFK